MPVEIIGMIGVKPEGADGAAVHVIGGAVDTKWVRAFAQAHEQADFDPLNDAVDYGRELIPQHGSSQISRRSHAGETGRTAAVARRAGLEPATQRLVRETFFAKPVAGSDATGWLFKQLRQDQTGKDEPDHGLARYGPADLRWPCPEEAAESLSGAGFGVRHEEYETESRRMG